MYTTLFLATILAFASGHIILESPPPFAFPADGHYNPLEPDGSDFPGKIPAGTTKLELNGSIPLWKAGEVQTLSFIGAAIHGGGSGQVSLLPGHEPSKTNSDFRVLKSWEGGFPMAHQKGNLAPNVNPSDKLEFTIPKTLPPGNYSLAFSWINRISGGNEFYMNIAPISIAGGTGPVPNDALKDYPPIFMANLGTVGKGCTTENGRAAQKAIQFPNPGSVVDHPEGTANPIKATCDGNPQATAGPGSPPSSSGSPSPTAPSAPTSTYAPPASSTPAPTTSVAPPTPTLSSGKPSTVPTTLVTSVRPSTTASPSSVAPPPSYTTSSSAPAQPSAPAGPCIEGNLLCHDDRVSFSTCTGGNFIGRTRLAPGTKCTPGAGVGLNITNPY
ncbi:hypothetical protein HYALB_00009630 [Hymenoscyphus albidus]|uniref:Chitin-binding type-4 domain-containing protein n=1 Tax=Hymenoscyphus albidus TaxID=595503 RepID=A0A9N9Q768_9HELO|nr:hypothetical protein HYALB_00009630 [Hymenoscyphus albidus]